MRSRWRSAVVVGGTGAAVMVAAGFVIPPAAQASTLTVTSNADSGAGSLRAALASATTGDTINFAPSVTGTINLDTPLTVTSAVTIAGPGAGHLSISGQNQVQDLLVPVGVGPVDVSGLTLTRGAGDYGGAVRDDGIATLTKVSVTNSAATHGGGGIVVGPSAILDLVQSTVSGNSAAWGGGIYASLPGNQGLTIQSSTINGNTATSSEGSAIYGTNLADQNTTTGGGGDCEVCCTKDVVTYRPAAACNTTGFRGDGVSHATAAGSGGALSITTSTIAENKALPGDAAIYLTGLGATSSIASSTVADNIGVGIAFSATAYSGSPQLASTIVAGNSSSDCASTPLADAGYNVDSDGSCGLSAVTGSQPAAAGITAALGPLAANGGPTRTMALALTSDPAAGVVPASFVNPGAGATVCATPDQRGVLSAATPCAVGAFQIEGAPTIRAVPHGDAADSGWYTGPVRVTFKCRPASPRVPVVSCSPPVKVSGDGLHHVVGRVMVLDGRTARVRVAVQIGDPKG